MSFSTNNNKDLIQNFEEDLIKYEQEVKVNSNNFGDYQTPVLYMKNSLTKLVKASEGDVYSMMRRLVTRISDKLDTVYSDFTVNMLAATATDLQTKQLIMTILYISREIVEGSPVQLDDKWFSFVKNKAIKYSLECYIKNKDILNFKYLLASSKDVKEVETDLQEYVLEVEDYNYKISFISGQIQKLKLKAFESENFPLVTQIVVTSTLSQFILDESIHFYDDALAQLSSLGCAPNGHIKGNPTLINLPQLFYKASFTLNSDDGKIWYINEFNIFFPSV